MVANAGFQVEKVEVSGVNRIDELKVYEITLAQKDRSMLLVDIDEVRDDLISNGWIKEARISRRLPDTLVVEIIEREPVAVWQREGKLSLIDKTGFPLEEIEKEEIPDLAGGWLGRRLTGKYSNSPSCSMSLLRFGRW